MKLKNSIRSMAAAIFVAVCLTGFTAGAQQVVSPVTPQDYGLWGSVSQPALAPDGKWAAWTIRYEDRRDTLFISSTDGKKWHAIAGASFGGFNKQRWLAYRKDGSLVVMDPQRGESKDLGNVGTYLFTASGKYCIYHCVEKGNTLYLLDQESGKQEVLPNVSEYAYSEQAGAVAFIQDSQLWLLRLGNGTGKQLITAGNEKSLFKIGWQDKGEGFTYLTNDDAAQTGEGTSAGYYNIRSGKRYVLDLDKAGLGGKKIGAYSNITVSADGKRIFFTTQGTLAEIPDKAASPQIWNASSKVIYPAQQDRRDQEATDVWVWWPLEGKCRQLTDSAFVKIAFSGDHKHALLWDPQQHEPHANLQAPADYYVYDVETGTKELLLKYHSAAEITVMPSPAGKYLAYFKDKHWHIYSFAKKTHTNITLKLGSVFEKEDFDWPEEAPPYDNIGWTENDGKIILYDRYDIWMITPDGKHAQKITNGRPEQMAYRVSLGRDQERKANFDGLQNAVFPKSGPLILKGSSPVSSGYYRWDSRNGVSELLTSQQDLSGVSFTARGDIAAVRQAFDTPPGIIVKNMGKDTVVLYQSNSHIGPAASGKVSLVKYRNSKGVSLSGALYYPSGYDPGKQYPMIVHIYQKQAWEHKRYVNPTLQNSSGFNIKHLTLSGYFVFLPDIVYEMGSPGDSALDCVTAAVRAAMQEAAVDKHKIGLIGHSFGGYETNYIISKTDMFAAAVSGAGITDFTSLYHYVVPTFNRANFWFFEHGQFRLGYPYFENRQGYIENSPLYHAENITTPLLMWCGKDDIQVHYFQMLSLHLALRRMGKMNYALLYPDEGHNIHDAANQRDLTIRISDWFGYLLKNEPKPGWL